MSNHRIYGHVTFECDLCASELETDENDFISAVQKKKAVGWKSRKDDDDAWIDVCDECVEKGR